MLMIWRGRGFVVPLAVIGLVFFTGNLDGQTSSKIFAALVVAVAMWFLGRKFENDGGSDHFWFIPVKYWGPIILVIGCFIGAGGNSAASEPPATAAEPAREATVQSSPVRESPPAQSWPVRERAPVTRASVIPPVPRDTNPPASEFPKIAQVYVDNTTHLYYLESCPRPERAYRIPRSVALLQGFRLASSCSPS
jgi:hypothetical protein